MVFAYKNEKTQEIVTCDGFKELAVIKAKSLAKGHIWKELKYVPIVITPAKSADYDPRIGLVNYTGRNC